MHSHKKWAVFAALLAICLCLPRAAVAQIDIKPGIGVNFSVLSEDPNSGEVQAKVGWQVGGTIMFGKKLYGEAGVFYLQRSTEFNSLIVDELNFDSKIKGFRIPATVGFHLLGNRTERLAIRIFGGGSAFIVTDSEVGLVPEDDINSPQWGVFAGAGIDFLFLYLDAKYEWSVTTHVDNSNFDVGNYRGLIVTAGIRF